MVATEAGGVHPTGMLSCFTFVYLCITVSSCRAIKIKAWYLDTRGFILKKIQWHIHAGLWSLVNCWREGSYEALYKVLMNINEAAVGLEEWPWP